MHFDLYRLEYVRDLFVFCCYTGLAYIDAMSLTPQHLSVGTDGETWIKTKRQRQVSQSIPPYCQKQSEFY
jgi:hypothetical protein